MSLRTHPRLVGAFVLGAAGLVLGSFVLLGSGEWFVRKDRFSVFFPGSVRGLGPGSAVTFRGVKVGEVKEVAPWATGRADLPIQIEVVFEVQRDQIKVPAGQAVPYADADTATLAERFIQQGVRARMLSQNLLTGQKLIELDFLPQDPARFAGLGAGRYPELPTTPTGMEKIGDRAEEFLDRLADIPVDKMLEDLQGTLANLNRVLSSEDFKEAVAGARRTTRELEPALREARAAAAEARRLMDTLGTEAKATGESGRATLDRAQKALDDAEKTLATLDGALRGADATRIDTARALEELTHTLAALRNLVDYIQTHPETVLQGKPRAPEGR